MDLIKLAEDGYRAQRERLIIFIFSALNALIVKSCEFWNTENMRRIPSMSTMLTARVRQSMDLH
jgi:hypothetical protein